MHLFGCREPMVPFYSSLIIPGKYERWILTNRSTFLEIYYFRNLLFKHHSSSFIPLHTSKFVFFQVSHFVEIVRNIWLEIYIRDNIYVCLVCVDFIRISIEHSKSFFVSCLPHKIRITSNLSLLSLNTDNQIFFPFLPPPSLISKTSLMNLILKHKTKYIIWLKKFIF